MNNILRKSQFKRDFKRVIRQGKAARELEEVLMLLMTGNPLPDKWSDHALRGNHKGFRELHISPDWLLMYKIEGDTLILYRTGSHAELFG